MPASHNDADWATADEDQLYQQMFQADDGDVSGDGVSPGTALISPNRARDFRVPCLLFFVHRGRVIAVACRMKRVNPERTFIYAVLGRHSDDTANAGDVSRL